MRNSKYWIVVSLFFMVIGGKSFSQTSDPISMVDSYGPYDENGKSNGLWTFIYSDGSTGHCVVISDKATGNWVRYWPNGKIYSIGTYELGRLNGFEQRYDSSGNVISLSYYRNYLPLYSYRYYSTGVIKEVGEYIIDTVDIGVINVDPDTYEISNTTRRDLGALKHGTWKFYDEKGVLAREEKYVRDILQE